MGNWSVFQLMVLLPLKGSIDCVGNDHFEFVLGRLRFAVGGYNFGFAGSLQSPHCKLYLASDDCG